VESWRIKYMPFLLYLGCITTTKVKIIAVVEDDILSDLPNEQQEKDAQIKVFMVGLCGITFAMLLLLRHLKQTRSFIALE
jgi:hypothetical protein